MKADRLIRRQLAEQLATAYAFELLADDTGLVDHLAAEGLTPAEVAEGRAELQRIARSLLDRLPVDLRGR